jgi:DNA-binding response OmpR family regulator
MSAPKRLLVLDDERRFAEHITEVARALGYAAVATNSAHEFQLEYLAAPPDVIVLDIVMPVKDGIEVMRWLVDNGCRARILIISGFSPSFAHAAQVIGESQGHLQITQMSKPVKLAELRARLTEGLVTTGSA